MNFKFSSLILIFLNVSNGYRHHHTTAQQSQNGPSTYKMTTLFSWTQIGYDFDGNFTNSYNTPGANVQNDKSTFYIPYNNIPVGVEAYGDRIFISVPRRQYGIPSTLNYVKLEHGSSPLLKPYPSATRTQELVSVYRPRVDKCGRLWMVDTGMLEVPGKREQLQPPSIVIYDLKTDNLLLKYELRSSVLVNERTPAGLTSITVDVDPHTCDDAYAYINDLATNGIVVFSLRQKNSWRIDDPTFVRNVAAMNFTIGNYVITWPDGLFSVALTEPVHGKRKAFYHPLVSTEEFSVDTEDLKHGRWSDGGTKHNLSYHGRVINLGNRGPSTQSGSHDYHAPTRTLFYANVAQDAVLCWNIDTQLKPENVGIVSQDHEKMVYPADLKVIGDEVWVLSNQITNFIYSTLDPSKPNFYVHKGKAQDLVRGTVCDPLRHV